jgi:PAS domain S-box-containing protein
MATILIVDDLGANREALTATLIEQGHRLITAADGGEGLSIIHGDRPDLVITDVMMPTMDGYEFVRRLRLDPTTSAIPVIFHTPEYGEREARVRAGSLGVSYVLTKRDDSASVVEAVSRALASAPGAAGATDTVGVSESAPEQLRLITEQLSETTHDLRIANAKLRALVNIGLELASERDTDRLLRRVCIAARELFGATYVTLGIVNLEDRTVQRFNTSGSGGAGWIQPGDAISGMLSTVVAERRTIRGDNPGGDPAAVQLPVLHPSVKAFLAAPVASPSQVYGWFCLVGNEGRTFTDEDESLVVALSGQLGRIYETAHYFAVAQKRSKELESEIFDHAQAETALRDAKDLSRHYLDAARVMLIAFDLDGRVTLVNRFACGVLGWRAEELIGRDWIDTCIPMADRARMRQAFAGIPLGRNTFIENNVITRSGEERLIEWRNSALIDEAGVVTGTFSSGSDHTERTQAIDAVRIAEERMRFALQGAGVGIWDLDYSTGRLQWSEILEAQYGLSPGTFEGTQAAFVEAIHPDDRARVVAAMTEAAITGSDFAVEHRTLWRDGQVRWLNGIGRIALDSAGNASRAVGISLDVTERHVLDEQYRQAQKMEAVGRLAGGIAHDFNNLLTVIIGYCEMLLSDLATDDPRQEYIREIHSAGASAAGLTRQLLAFSRKQVTELTLVNMNAVVTGVRPMLGRLIGEDIDIRTDLLSDLSNITADRGQVEQIVMNLVVNARDAMPNGGTLTIETANVELDEQYAKMHISVTAGRYVRLTVTDTGVGMPADVKARLFEPFFTTKEPGKGTGLGLATVHGIVTRANGSVNVYSELGHGTSVSVYFPRAAGVHTPLDLTAIVELPRGEGRTVLVVEDALTLRALTRRLLERQGYTVLTAANTKEAIRVWAANPAISLLLTDVVMPGGSGPDLAKRLVAERADLRVIYMSGYTENAIVQQGALNSEITFLHKPFTAEILGLKLRDAYAKEREN